MSAENVRTVHRWFEAISSDDSDAALALGRPDMVLVPPGDQKPYVGTKNLRRWMEPDAFPGQVVTPMEVVVVTDRTILARQHVAARGRASGIELDVNSWTVWTFDDDGLIARIEIYLEHEEDRAREAAGLRE